MESCASLFNVVHMAARSFRGCERSILDLKLFFLNSLFNCLLALGSFSYNSLLDMIDHCTTRA